MKIAFWLTFGLVMGIVGGLWLAPSPKEVPPPAPPSTMAHKPAPVAAQVAAPTLAPSEIEKKETVIGPEPLVEPAQVPNACTAFLNKLSLVEMRAQCGRAERGWLKRNLDEFAVGPKDSAEKQIFLRELFDQLKDGLKANSWWKGEADFPNGDSPVHLEVMLKIYGAHEADLGDPFKSNSAAKITTPEELCYALSPYVSVNGKTDTISYSSCGSYDRKRGDTFYMTYNSYSMDKIGPVATVILFPFPAKKAAPMEYLASSSSQWKEKPEFIWRPSSYGEWQDMHDRYVQNFEH